MITYTVNEYGLRDKDMDYMLQLFASILTVEKVILFGSRAMGGFQQGSDVDMAIVGAKVTPRDIAYMRDKLENDSPTILGFDILHYDTLKHDQLKEQIEAYGKVIYTK